MSIQSLFDKCPCQFSRRRPLLFVFTHQDEADFGIKRHLDNESRCIRAGEVCAFFDWAECRLVRRIDVTPKEVKWSESGDLGVVVCEESFFVLRVNRELRVKRDGGAHVSEKLLSGGALNQSMSPHRSSAAGAHPSPKRVPPAADDLCGDID